MSMPAKKAQGALGREWGALKKKGKRFVSSFMFEMFIEEFYPRLIEEMRSSLAYLSPADIKQMIAHGQYPELPANVYAALHGYEDYLQSVTVSRLWKALIEACPDLATAIDEVGDSGYHWFIRFRLRILNGISAGAAPNAPGEASVPMVGLTCDSCGKTHIVRKDRVSQVKECPFCHTPAEGAPPPPQLPPAQSP